MFVKEELLKDVLDTMARANINYCAKTTYDYSVSECSRLEMIRVLREEYSIAYQPVIPREELFPVPRGR